MNILDVRTILISYTISNAICAAVMASLWSQNRRRSPELGFWLVNYILQFVSVMLISLRGILPDFISVLFGTPLVIGGTLLLYIGLQRYVGKTTSQLLNFICLTILIITHTYFTFIQPSLMARNVILSAGLLIFCTQAAWLLLYRVDSKNLPGTRVTGAVFTIYALVNLARIFIDLVVKPGEDLLKLDIYDTLVILSYQMLFIGLTFALFLMVNRGLFTALEKDILERNIVEEEVRSLSRFPVENPNPILRIARNGSILYANPASAPLLAAWERKVGQDLPPDWNSQVKTALDSGDIIEVEMDCQGRIFLCHFTPIESENYVNIYGREFTEEKHAIRSLRESEARYRSLFANMLNGLAYCRMIFVGEQPDDFIYLEVNEAFEKLTGLKEVTGKKVSEIIPGIQQSDPELFKIYGRVAITGIPETFETHVLAMDMWFAVSVYCPQKGYFVAVFDVINERKRSEAALKAYSEKLEGMVEERTHELREAQEKLVRHEKLAMLGQLAGSVSHELRNPLGVISNAVYYLNMSQPDVDPKIKEYLDIIQNETRTADKIITDLLDYSRIKTVDRIPVVAADLVESLLQRYPVPEGIKVVLKFPRNLPLVYTDPHHLTQVLGNLLVNAFQAMPTASIPGYSEGKVIISGKRTDSIGLDREDGHGYVAISVKDTGVGIAPENLGKLFEPLFTTKARGIGLGLAICKSLVEASGGQIEVKSEPGKGSTFTVFIPIYEETK